MNNFKNDEALKVQIYKFTLGLFFCYVPLSQLYIYLRMAFGCHFFSTVKKKILIFRKQEPKYVCFC